MIPDKIHKTVWVGAWINRCPLGHCKVENASLLQAVTVAKVEYAIDWLRQRAKPQLELPKLMGMAIPEMDDPFEIPGLGPVRFIASNHKKFACTTAALRRK